MDDIIREMIIGDWQEELSGTDLLDLGPTQDRFRQTISLRSDGTAWWRYPAFGGPAVGESPMPPFPQTWSLSDERALTIYIPIAPMPQYGLPDWTREAVRYDVLAVSDWSLGLTNRRFDGEHVIVMRRIATEEYERRQVGRYKEALAGAKEILRRSGVDI